MKISTYMGVDPGPSTGIVLLFIHEDIHWEWRAFQVDGNTAFWLTALLYDHFSPRAVGIEQFIPMNKGGTSGKNAELTRRIADHAYQLAKAKGIYARLGKAADVKPWATDRRLEKTGFPLGPKFRDARDAARHAAYTAVMDGKERDPLA